MRKRKLSLSDFKPVWTFVLTVIFFGLMGFSLKDANSNLSYDMSRVWITPPHWMQQGNIDFAARLLLLGLAIYSLLWTFAIFGGIGEDFFDRIASIVWRSLVDVLSYFLGQIVVSSLLLYFLMRNNVPPRVELVAWLLWALIALVLTQQHFIRRDFKRFAMPRTITRRQASNLEEFLSQHDKQTVIIKHLQDDEALNYRNDLIRALKSAGWDVQTQNNDKPPHPISDGIKVVQGDVPGSTGPKGLLYNALKYAKIEAGCETFQYPEPHPYLLVGRRPSMLHRKARLTYRLDQWWHVERKQRKLIRDSISARP